MVRILLLMTCGLLLSQPSAVAQPESELNRGRTAIDPESGRIGYRKSWALIIGINYADAERTGQDRLVLPELRNAEADATALRNLLISHYGYQPENVMCSERGSTATYQWIQDSLRKLCDAEQVSNEDSVLVFFAGHGERLESTMDAAALYPYDVKFSAGRPQATTYLRVHSDLVEVIETSPARHKLIILDSCYSGEIFNVGAQPRSEVDDRGATALAETPCLQALTSCRSLQVASDGPGANSPFTKGLLDALKQLPARHRDSERIWTNWLFAYMRPGLTLPNGQCPDCRNLSGDGEFGFFPDRRTDWAKEFLPSAADYQMLQVSAGSEQGQWWFDENPWFLPALRQPILSALNPDRSGIANLRMDREKLKNAARTWLINGSSSSLPSPSVNVQHGQLTALRTRHLGLLLGESNRDSLDQALESIVSDLSASEINSALSAEDLHLLAVVQHKLGLPAAEQCYQRAVAAYKEIKFKPGATEVGQPSTPHQPSGNALLALCKADFGEYLLSNPSQHFGADASREAASLFREASEECQWQGPASFNIFVRCREADAWLSQNRWFDADLCLRDALDLAKGIGPRHYLTAFVHRRRAWAQMTKWEISDAVESFKESNRLLADWMAANDGVNGQTVDEQKTFTAPFGDDLLEAIERVQISGDHQTRIAYFHNLHGLAMAYRFHGDTTTAVSNYRALAMELEHALGQVRRRRSSDTSEETDLLERLINSLERLGDCNLFGDPNLRDVSEAIDDYDRARSRIHFLTPSQRNKWQSRLSWKQALALSLPSAVQDLALASELTQQADQLSAAWKLSARGMDQALGELTTPMVELMAAAAMTKSSTAQESPLTLARTRLRTTLEQFRDLIGANPHRDQLELCLFGAELLVRHGQESNPLLSVQDTDMLLSFCRIPLAPYDKLSTSETSFSDSRRYLRPFYDTAIASLIDVDSRSAKKLLRLQWEATRGSVCPKPETSIPVIAIYFLQNEPFLMYSMPNGPSSWVRLGERFSAEEVIAACQGDDEKGLLPLPRHADQDFRTWYLTRQISEPPIVEVRLCPQVEVTMTETSSALEKEVESAAGGSGSTTIVAKPVNVRFPFKMPEGFLLRSHADFE